MTLINLTPDQSRQLATAIDGVVIADNAGNVVVRLPAKSSDSEAAIIAEARRRLATNQPGRPLAEFASRMQPGANS